MLFFQNYSNLYPPNKTLCARKNIKYITQYCAASIFYLNYRSSYFWYFNF
ncbi:hypothetical protein [Spiroplasma endosymbiont of Dilophus febrilis]